MTRGASQAMSASHTADTQADLYYPITYASAAYSQLAPSVCTPQALKAPLASHGTASKTDRASFLDLAVVFGAVVIALIGAASLILGIGYWFV